MRRRLIAAAVGAAAGGLLAPAARAAFERAPLSPEAAAMGGVLAAGPDGVWGNPAGASLVEPLAGGRVLQSGTARPFGLPDLTELQVAVRVERAGGAIGLGARRFGSQVYEEKELRLVLAGSPVPSMSLGAAARALSAGGDFAPVRSFALDVAFRVQADSATVLGAEAEAVLGEVPGDPRGEGRRTAFGVARRLGAGSSLRLELQRQGRGPLAPAVGFSWTPWRPLTLRAGAREDPRTVTWGFTVRRGSFSVSGAAAHTALGRTLRIGLRAAS